MSGDADPILDFYRRHLGEEVGDTASTSCPFCAEHGLSPGRLSLVLSRQSFFHGYFRCANRCVPGGFPLWFARLAAVSPQEVPGYVPELELPGLQPEYPVENLNDELAVFADGLTEALIARFHQGEVGAAVLREMRIGYNGRYLVYPYILDDGNCYAARCVHPDRAEDFFWHGNLDFAVEPHTLYNFEDLKRCENGALFLCEGEDSLLALRQLGFPGVAVAHYSGLEKQDAGLFAKIKTLFIAVANSHESETAARNLAARIGYKARILPWPAGTAKHQTLFGLARALGKGFAGKVAEMVRLSRAFSPFATPQREYQLFRQTLQCERGEEYRGLLSGFPLFDQALGGVHGINVIGGAPKLGKSTFIVQIASTMAGRGIPVLYYDFENGRQKLYSRTLCRLASLSVEQVREERLGDEEGRRLQNASKLLEKMLFCWRVINDRKVTPELMRKHIDFIRHETRSDYTVVVIDSLHKLPFNNFSERRTGIDAWLRQLESMRDDLQVSFLVISELSRDQGGSYREEPHLGVFKGSGDIEYSADNAMVLYPDYPAAQQRSGEMPGDAVLWLVASREHSPGRIARYRRNFPYWGFLEEPLPVP